MKKINVILISLLVLSVNAASAAKLDPVFAQPTPVVAAATEFADSESTDENTQIQEQFEELVQNFLDTKAPSKAKRAGVVIGRNLLAGIGSQILISIIGSIFLKEDANSFNAINAAWRDNAIGEFFHCHVNVNRADLAKASSFNHQIFGVLFYLLTGAGIGISYVPLFKCGDHSLTSLKKINDFLSSLTTSQKIELITLSKKALKKIARKVDMEKDGAGMKFASVVLSGDLALILLSIFGVYYAALALCNKTDGKSAPKKALAGVLALTSIAAAIAGIISPIYKYKNSPSKQKEAFLANIKKMLTQNQDEEAVA